jgi:hypothetical protein
MEFLEIAQDMKSKGQLTILQGEYLSYPQTRYIPQKKADLTLLKGSEMKVLDDVIDQFSDRTASWISKYSHEDIPWKATADKDVIDYELVFYRTPPFSVRDYPDEEE